MDTNSCSLIYYIIFFSKLVNMENIELLIIFCILLGLSNWFIYIQNNKYPKYNYDDNILEKLNKYIIELKNNNQILEKNLIYRENENIIPPERKYMINFPTRGFPDDYQLIGILIELQDKTMKDKVYNLYGRQTYPGSNLYEYYVHAIIDNNNIKIPLSYNKEIFDGQEIKIMKNTEIYKVKLYPYNLPRYIP